MDNRKAEYEIEQLKRKLSQTIEERDRAMANCHELWKRLNSLMSLAAASTASYTMSSGLPTSPSDSYDSANSRSKSTSPNSSAASLKDSLLSSTTTATTNSNNQTATNNNNAASNHISTPSQQTTTTTATSQPASKQHPNIKNNNNNQQHQINQNGSTQIIPINLKRPIEAINSHLNMHHNNHHLLNQHTNNHHHSTNSSIKLEHNNSSTNNNSMNTNTHATSKTSPHKSNSLPHHHHQHHQQLQHHHNNSNNNHHATLLHDKNNNHPLIVEVPKELNQTVGEIVEIAPGQFKCRYCDKTFDRIFSVHRHERVHTGYKPCKCNECGRGFSEKRNLRHHIIRFHSDGSGRELLKRNRNKVSGGSNRQQQFGLSNASLMNSVNSQITATSASSVITKGALQQLQHQRQLNNTNLSSLANGNDHNNNNTKSNVLKNFYRCTTTNGGGSVNNGVDEGEDDDEDDDDDMDGDADIDGNVDDDIDGDMEGDADVDGDGDDGDGDEDDDVDMTSSDYRALCNQLTSLKGEMIDTSGLSVLGAAAAVITVNSSSSSSSSRRRKSKPSKKIITNA